jgi:hypothetical protein
MLRTVIGFKKGYKECWGFHKWKVDKDISNGFTIYRVCKKCTRREITQPSYPKVYQPIDISYLSR